MRRITITFALVAALALSMAAGVAAADTTEIDVQIEEDGDAVWTVTTETALETEDERQGFQRIVDDADRRADFAEDTRSQFAALAERAGEHVARDMTVSDASATASLDGDVGTTVVEFTWSGFGAVEEGSVTVGDVFEGGLSLEEGTTITVHAPEGYVVADADAPDAEVGETSVTWTGPVDFEGDVSITFSEAEDVEDDGEGLPGFTVALAAVALAALIAGRQFTR